MPSVTVATRRRQLPATFDAVLEAAQFGIEVVEFSTRPLDLRAARGDPREEVDGHVVAATLGAHRGQPARVG